MFEFEIPESKNMKREVYKTYNDVNLHLYIFEPENRDPKELLPVIVFFHGGGWTGGDPSQFFPQCEYFSKRGMMAISVEYCLKSKHGTSPVESVLTENLLLLGLGTMH